MEISKIMTADVLDIIFEGRNKTYGAYDLRKTYKRRLLTSLSVMLSILLLLIGGYIFANMGDKQVAKEIIIPPDTELTLLDQEEPPVEPPPPLKQPPPQQIETIQYTVPKIAPDEQVKPDEQPPAVDDLADVKIGTANVEGNKDDGTVAPPSDEAAGKGIVLIEKKKEEEPEIFTKVEIDAKYPGGLPAWARFLNKNLANNYPQEAIDNEIQGKVEIMFVVDTLGNVSNVEAVGGPKELWDAAVKVIKKSGKWEPAIQNGRRVKAYKRQPIVFQLSQD
ncbi:MAG: energy transducer TonB [Azospira oryzae]|nr:MAG: energy transducer TonB [Azospira oryzae]